MQALPPQTRVGQYEIDTVVRILSSALIYHAYDSITGTHIYLIEHFPPHLAERDTSSGILLPSTDEEAYEASLQQFEQAAKEGSLSLDAEPATPLPALSSFSTLGTIYAVVPEEIMEEALEDVPPAVISTQAEQPATPQPGGRMVTAGARRTPRVAAGRQTPGRGVTGRPNTAGPIGERLKPAMPSIPVPKKPSSPAKLIIYIGLAVVLLFAWKQFQQMQRESATHRTHETLNKDSATKQTAKTQTTSTATTKPASTPQGTSPTASAGPVEESAPLTYKPLHNFQAAKKTAEQLNKNLVVIVYGQGWDKWGDKVLKEIIQSPQVNFHLNKCIVLEIPCLQEATEAEKKEWADQTKGFSSMPRTLPALVLYNAQGDFIEAITSAHPAFASPASLSKAIKEKIAQIDQQKALLAQAGQETGTAKAELLAKAYENMGNAPKNLKQEIEKLDPQKSLASTKRLTADAMDIGFKMKDIPSMSEARTIVQNFLAEPAYTPKQKQEVLAGFIGKLRREKDSSKDELLDLCQKMIALDSGSMYASMAQETINEISK